MSGRTPPVLKARSAEHHSVRALIGAGGADLRASELAPLLKPSERQTRVRLSDHAAALA